MAATQTARSGETIECDLCVIGAGITGLNAVFAASHYLGENGRIVLVDRKAQAGGMWNETYDYARLHQPYNLFTVGDIGWSLAKPASYLAAKDEVLGHLRGCLSELHGRVTLIERFGYCFDSHRELATDQGTYVEIHCHDTASEQSLTIYANRCVKAFGADIPQTPALRFASRSVRSISLHDGDVFGAEMTESRQPIYVIGGGKTAMDTAKALIRTYPTRSINMVLGQGVAFQDRETLFPTGLRRWLGGTMPVTSILDTVKQFTGANIDETFDYFADRYCLRLNDNARQCRFGLLSQAELGEIANGLDSATEGYVDDIVDVEGQPVMILRDGQRHAIEPGSWIINCTGYILRHHDDQPYEPYCSPSGAVVSINPLSATLWFPSYAGYLLVHLLYRDQLHRLPLYEVNFRDLEKINKTAVPIVAMTQMLHNILLMQGALPAKVFQEMGVDFNRWYPIPRQILLILRMALNRRRYLEHCRRALDKANAELGIRCGPLRANN